MNFTHLNTFLVAAEEESFSKAARRLFLSTPSLIQQIKLLEQELGFSLFYRHYNGIVLTEAGREFYAGARRTVELMDQTVKRSLASANREKVLRLSLGDPAFAPVLERFERTYPDVHIQFADIPYDGMEYGLECLEKDELDLLECEDSALIASSGLSFQAVFTTPLCAFVAFRHPLARQASVTLEGLSGERVIVYRYCFSANESLQEAGFQPSQIVNTRFSVTEVLNALETGAVYLLEQATAQRLWPFGALVPLAPEIAIRYGLAYKTASPLVRSFLALLPESGQ